MENRQITAEMYFGIIPILLFFILMPVSGESIPNLEGSWVGISVDQYSPEDGFLNRTGDLGPYQINNQKNRAFVGEETYYDSATATNTTERFAGALSPDGKTYTTDEEGSGITFGEIISDHELFNMMLFEDRGPMVIVSHMVKTGEKPSPEDQIPSMIGIWNVSDTRNTSTDLTRLISINQQEGQIWSGTEQIQYENGTTSDVIVVGSIGVLGRIYVISKDGEYIFGSLAGNNSIQSTTVIPGDINGIFVSDRWMTRDEIQIPQYNLSYPDISGDWKIDDRKVIQKGNITEVGPVSSEWMSYGNQTGRSFTVTRHVESNGTSKEYTSSAIFRTPDEAYLTNAESPFVIYHILDNSSIEAIINKKDRIASLTIDTLTRKDE